MAFDLINYIYDQTIQQHRGILAEHSKSEKHTYLKHIIAFQLTILQKKFQDNPASTYQDIIDLNTLKLQQESLKLLNKAQSQTAFFTAIEEKIPTINQKVSKTLIQELHQFDQNGHLMQSGLQELINGQQEWVTEAVDEWFWDVLQQPEKKLTKSNKKENADFQQIIKDFNKVLHEQHHTLDHDLHLSNTNLEAKTHQIGFFYRIVNPIVAILILYYLYNVIL